MDLLLEPMPTAHGHVSLWKNPPGWLRHKDLSHDFWLFFTAAFFFDAGFSVYFFLFNLYLLDFGFRERAIGLVGGALTFGSLVGTLPAGMLARKFGVRPLLVFCFVAAPLVNAVRLVWMVERAQIALAFLTGLAMCSWGVSFLTAVARLTTEKNRASAFSLIFSVSIGTSALGGMICGYLPNWLNAAGFLLQPADVKRLILLASCCVAFVGLFPVMRLRLPLPTGGREPVESLRTSQGWLGKLKKHPFLLRFLPLMALWSAVIASFAPFANVYLSSHLGIPLSRIGLIFSSSQVVQLCAGLLTPLALCKLGLMNGVVATQAAAAVALASMAGVKDGKLAVISYLTFSAAQWMSSPGLYNLLMNETPDNERSTAAAITLFCNALAGSAATAGAGILFARFGYLPVLLGIAGLALAVALLFRLLVAPQKITNASVPESPSQMFPALEEGRWAE